MNDFANGFLKGYKAAVEDAVSGFFANMDIYDGFTSCGVFTYFLNNITLEDLKEGIKYEATMKECIEICLEDWLISHYAEIKRDFEEEEKSGIVISQLRTDRDRLLDVLDKIRAEIIDEKDFAYADFEQYKVDYLGVDAEYVEDELPQDDFRYGMERALEIIDKYKAESEVNKNE